MTTPPQETETPIAEFSFPPPQPLETPEAVNEFIDGYIAAGPTQDAIDRMSDQTSLEARGVKALWDRGGIGVGSGERQDLLRKMGVSLDPDNLRWLKDLQDARIRSLEGSASLHSFNRYRFSSEEDFTDAASQAYADMLTNRERLKLSKTLFTQAARTPEEMASAASVWMGELLRSSQVDTRRSKYGEFDKETVLNAANTAQRISEQPGETRTMVDIASDAFIALSKAAGSSSDEMAGRIHRYLLAYHGDDLVPSGDLVQQELIKKGLPGGWELAADARFSVTEDEDGALVRRYTQEGLDAVYEAIVEDVPSSILGKKPKGEVLSSEASYVIEDTLMVLAETDQYAQNILKAYRTRRTQPVPGRFLSPSFSDFIKLANGVVEQGMGSLPEAQQTQLDPLDTTNASNITDALRRMVYVINPDLFNEEGHSDADLLQLSKRLELVEALIGKSLEIEERSTTVVDFIMKCALEGKTPEETEKELRLLNAGRPDTGATRNYRSMIRESGMRSNQIRYNLRNSGSKFNQQALS